MYVFSALDWLESERVTLPEVLLYELTLPVNSDMLFSAVIRARAGEQYSFANSIAFARFFSLKKSSFVYFTVPPFWPSF